MQLKNNNPTQKWRLLSRFFILVTLYYDVQYTQSLFFIKTCTKIAFKDTFQTQLSSLIFVYMTDRWLHRTQQCYGKQVWLNNCSGLISVLSLWRGRRSQPLLDRETSKFFTLHAQVQGLQWLVINNIRVKNLCKISEFFTIYQPITANIISDNKPSRFNSLLNNDNMDMNDYMHGHTNTVYITASTFPRACLCSLVYAYLKCIQRLRYYNITISFALL